MSNEFDDEIIIDFSKIGKTLWQRKILIAKVFFVVMVIFAGVTLITPKKYVTESNIYINKANTTNLADINPFILSSSMGGEGAASILSGMNNNLQNEIEIIQSPLVIENVIKENNLRYKKGKKKGEFISADAFLKKNISIEDKKGTNIISISYKSQDPILCYNVVNSIISNYQRINAEINTKKASSDKKLLKSSYVDASRDLDQKLSNLKHSGGLPPTAMAGTGMLNAMRGHNSAISRALGGISSQVVEGQKSQIAVDQEVGKVNMIKSKLEWTSLVEQMSKNVTNVIILKQPELKRDFEYSEPKLMINIILGAIFACFASIIAVIWAESTDKTLTYSTLGEKIIYNTEKNMDDLKILLLSNQNERISVIAFEGFPTYLLQTINLSPNIKIVEAEINQQTINEITNSDKLILAGKIGATPKKIYQQIKTICTETNKKITAEII